MKTVATLFPKLIEELVSALNAEGRTELSEQLLIAVVERVTFDKSADAGYIYLRPTKALNVVETNIIHAKHGETIAVESKYWMNLDVDNFGRPTGVEVMSPPGRLKAELRKHVA